MKCYSSSNDLSQLPFSFGTHLGTKKKKKKNLQFSWQRKRERGERERNGSRCNYEGNQKSIVDKLSMKIKKK